MLYLPVIQCKCCHGFCKCLSNIRFLLRRRIMVCMVDRLQALRHGLFRLQFRHGSVWAKTLWSRCEPICLHISGIVCYGALVMRPLENQIQLRSATRCLDMKRETPRTRWRKQKNQGHKHDHPKWLRNDVSNNRKELEF